MLSLLPLTLLPLALGQYTATYTVGSLPASSEEGQSGTNQCGTTSSQTSSCQNAFLNSVDDFCLWGPPDTKSNEGDGTSKIGNVEQIVVSYCLKDGYGTRLIPSGTITGAHFVKVVNDKVSYVQVTGQGDLTKLLIPAGDEGGELDPHSWTGLGNPQGGLVFTNAFSGNYEQTHEWTSFMSSNDFCFRACRDGPNAPGYCEHIYDVLSCGFTIPGSHDAGFDECDGDPTDEAPGVYGGSTFHQDDPTTPAPHPPGATSNCKTYQTIGGGTANLAASVPVTTSAPSSSSSINVTSSIANSTTVSNITTSTSTSISQSTTSAPVSTSGIATAGNAAGSSRTASTSAAAASQSNGAASSQLTVGGGLLTLVMGLAMSVLV